MQHRQCYHCCTATEVFNFGEGSDCKSLSSCMYGLKAAIRHAVERGHGLVMCYTSNEQTPLNKALRANGFKRTAWVKKRKSFGTKVAMWHLKVGHLSDRDL